MKASTAWSFWLHLAGAATLQPQKVSYDGYKVFRVAVGEDAERLTGIISKLGLKTWKGAPKAGATADVVVPPRRLTRSEPRQRMPRPSQCTMT